MAQSLPPVLAAFISSWSSPYPCGVQTLGLTQVLLLWGLMYFQLFAEVINQSVCGQCLPNAASSTREPSPRLVHGLGWMVGELDTLCLPHLGRAVEASPTVTAPLLLVGLRTGGRCREEGFVEEAQLLTRPRRVWFCTKFNVSVLRQDSPTQLCPDLVQGIGSTQHSAPPALNPASPAPRARTPG